MRSGGRSVRNYPQSSFCHLVTRMLRAIHVVPAAETDISGVAIELPVGREEGLPAGVVRVALARQDRINCTWLVSLQETDLNERAGALSEENLSKLAEMLRLGGLE